MKDYAKSFYKGNKWQQCRNAYIRSRSYLCEDCMCKGIVKGATEVHHVIPITQYNINDPNITLNWNNLKSLCHDCHMARHNEILQRRYTVDEVGRVSPNE